MPGFVDTHRHTWQTPVRGVLPCCTLDHYFAVMLGQVGGHYRPEDVHIGNYAGALEALNGGVTTLLDWSHINNTPEHSDAAIQGLKDAGIRAIYAHGMPTGGEWWSFSELEHPEDIRRIRKTYFSSDDGLLTLAMAARRPATSTPDVAKHDWELARELGIRISVHVGMRCTASTEPREGHARARADGPRHDVHPLHRLDRRGARLIAETGGTASVAPYVEMLMGHGPPPTGRLLARGVRPSLSVDVVSSVPGEMFTQMRTALVHERILAFTDTPDMAFAPTLTHRTCSSSRRSTARAPCALEDKVGTLTPGKQADIVLLEINAINTAPVVDPMATIVIFADTSNVDSVFVAGHAVKRDGQLVGVDIESVIQKLEESRNHIRREGGLLPEWAAEPMAAAVLRSRMRERMATGNVVIIGGTKGLGRELAQSYADSGRDVVVSGRDRPARRPLRRRDRRPTRGIGFDLAEPHGSRSSSRT